MNGYIFFIFLFMIGCATNKYGETVISVPTHGYFCGPNHPPVRNTSKIDNVIELMTIKPFDDIDSICQRHDICYEVTGYLNQRCDAWLVSEIEKLNFDPKDFGHQLHCKNIQYGITSSWGIASSRTRTPKTGIPIKDTSTDIQNYLLHQAGGYIAAGFNITLDAASNKLDNAIGITPKKSNNYTKSNSKSAYDPMFMNLLFYSSLIEMLNNKNLIDDAKAAHLCIILGIDTKPSSFQRLGKMSNINHWKDHPVLSGNWNLTP